MHSNYVKTKVKDSVILQWKNSCTQEKINGWHSSHQQEGGKR